MPTDLPPTYTQEPSETDAQASDDSDSFVSAHDGAPPDVHPEAAPADADAGEALGAEGGSLQILIIPVAEGYVHFQKGYLGADGERAAIEGELQIKSADTEFRWRKVSVSLRSVERAPEREIELAYTELVLADAPDPSPQQRSSFPFSIPLPPDTPQCLHTSRSSLAYSLTATVWPVEEAAPLRRSLIVHTRRYTSHTHHLQPVPETRIISEPSRVEVQLPRTMFKAGEPIPIYITVPTPPADLVVEQGQRLRNLRAELVRVININRSAAEEDELNESDFEDNLPPEGGQLSSQTQKTAPGPSTSRTPPVLVMRRGEHGERKVVTFSGASCRLHPSRALRIRLVLHQPNESTRPDSSLHHPPSEDTLSTDLDAQCAYITQSTVLHSVSFRLLVHATFIRMSSHTETVSTVSIPLLILPPSAPLPEVESSVDSAYMKKHDRPPTRTVRAEDAEVPQYEAGPSAIPGAPPPFEEREAPPPFWSAAAEASTSTHPPSFLEADASSSRLPTFLESEREIYVPSAEYSSIVPSPAMAPTELAFEGEGSLFGFSTADQFDGYADVVPQRSFTPPPSVEMATHDADVTGLANMDLGQPAAIEALGLALEQQNITLNAHEGSSVSVGVDERFLPPPPPPMDDPSDPPPSIDSAEFRAPGAAHDSPPRAQSPPAHVHTHAIISPPPHDEGESHGHAPPPYRVPGMDHDHGHDDHERVTNPPPYMDLVHENH
ncbi:hypothetical protein GSI_06778 [Ganoderma sinense ZZ0214-1]|uniref:Uncharacterized protein n=1 Tax=Ganoderma sinense ZZ0214-1 TaxID=1077348 RepID=A0A2G8SE76_9APHY|nr:hypothetical protein GSI_06778 [Ganoderma sinense ZZ0214-1]